MNIKDIEPTIGNVLVEIEDKPTEVDGFILAGDQENTAPVSGLILRTSEQSKFKVGETIFFRKYAIDELKFKNAELVEEVVYIIDEKEVLGVVRPLEEVKDKEPEQKIRAETKEADNELKDKSKKQYGKRTYYRGHPHVDSPQLRQ